MDDFYQLTSKDTKKGFIKEYLNKIFCNRKLKEIMPSKESNIIKAKGI